MEGENKNLVLSVESFSQRVKSGVLRLGSVIVEVLFASVAAIYSCALVYVLSGPLEIATLFVN